MEEKQITRAKSPSFWKLEKKHLEKVRGVSLTVPDESLTIREIVDRFVRTNRMDETLYREPSYDSGASLDSDDLQSVQRMDLTEREELLGQRKLQYADMKNAVETAAKSKAAKAKKADGGEAATFAGSSPDEEESGRGTRERTNEDGAESASSKPRRPQNKKSSEND